MKILESQQGKRCDEADYLAYTHKRCSQCLAVKTVSLFYRKKAKTKRGWNYDSQCVDCSRQYCRAYSAENKSSRNARLREWRKRNPEKAKEHDRNGMLKLRYGLSIQLYEEMKAAQDGRCAICLKAGKKLFVDHCHTRGHVRSLLCQTCNTFLGWYEKKADTIAEFQSYIEKHSK